MTIYFSHPTTDFNTKIENLVEAYIEEFFEETVENPNQSKHQIGYQKYGMDYYNNIIKAMDKCVFMRMPNKKLGAGVAKEVQQFFEQGKPVYEFLRNEHVLVEVTEMPSEEEIMSIEETRAEIKALLKR